MNETQFTSLLQRSASQLETDVGALVADAASSGRRSLRRRRIAAGLAAASAVGAVALVVTVLPGGSTTATDPGFAAPVTAGSQRGLADADVIQARLLDALPDGQASNVTIESDGAGADGVRSDGHEIELLLDGAHITVRVGDFSMDPEAWKALVSQGPGPRPDGCDGSLVAVGERDFNRVARAAETDSERACLTWVVRARERECVASSECLAKRTTYSPRSSCGDPKCRELPDGSWLWLRSGDGGDGSDTSGFRGNWAGLFTADGWMIDVAAFNSDDADAPRPRVVTDDPPLTLEQAEEIATSGLWFE